MTRILIFIFLLYNLNLLAQTPQGFKYQTAIRDNSGNLMANKLVSLKISLLRGSPVGIVIYIETHNISTTDYGIANLNIGNGNVIQGIFSQIDWANGPYYLKTELDINNGTNFLFMGTTQLLSVPFALYAAKSANAENDMDKDSLNEIQQINLNGNQLQLSKNGGQVNFEKYIDNTDSQSLSLEGNTLRISRGNSIVLSGVVDLDGDPMNELQSLSVNKDTLRITKTNYILLPNNNDNDSANEVQTLSIVGNRLNISKGNQVNIDADTLNEIQTISTLGNKLFISKGNQVNVDSDTSNEIQSLLRNGDTLSISKGNSILLPKNNFISGTYLYSNKFNDSTILNLGFTFLGGISTVIDTFDWIWYSSTSNLMPASARKWHTSVWNGSYMIVFGGQEISTMFKDVAKYDPYNGSGSWTTGTSSNGPPRMGHSAIWTGTEMIVWGGMNQNGNFLNFGEKYNPTTDTWTTISSFGAPSPRRFHSAIWTGTEMIIWGGTDSLGVLNNGKKYNPITNTWGAAVSLTNAPAGRYYHSAIWTGLEMIIWGGTSGTILNDGARYNPVSNSWNSIVTNVGAPSARWGHSAIWNGNSMFLWGGHGSADYNDGYIYIPLTNSWKQMNPFGAPLIRTNHSAIWTGTDMVIWGGSSNSAILNGGALLGNKPIPGKSRSLPIWLYIKN
jgi:hypothetical protein